MENEIKDSNKELEEALESKNALFRDKVIALSSKMRNMRDLPDLIDIVYSERQVTLEYYHAILQHLSKLNKEYKIEYAAKYNYYKAKSDIRYSSDSAINAQVSAVLADYIYKIELMNNHAKYIGETIKSIDDIIYGIQNRIRVEEILLGKS
jgi:hypothetical protein